MDIIELLSVLSQCLDKTSLRRLHVIVPALLSMSGRVTMLGISRWTEGQGSYRTVQRFYNTSIPWGMVLWLFFRTYLYQAEQAHLLVGDESVVTKAGQETHGLDRFFSSIFGKPVKGLAFFTLSVVSIGERKSYPLQVEQVVRSDAEKAESAQKKRRKASQKSSKTKGKPGRPKGRQNKDKRQFEWTPELSRVARMAAVLLKRMGSLCDIRYFVLDGHFGNNNVMQMVRQRLGLHLISKLRHDSALYFLYDGPQKARGRKRIYGAQIDYQDIPTRYRVSSTIHNAVQTDIYQATMLHKSFADRLNVVILVKTNLRTQKRAHVVLFSSDLDLGYEQLVDFYRLRFQIEFNFRDAKQFWGFEDFMNVKQTPVNNAVGLAFFMVNLSALLVQRFRPDIPDFGILDLKAHFRSRRFITEALKLLPDSVDTVLLHDLLDGISPLGAIHSHNNPSLTP
jgi:hypothetical protein